MQLNRALHAVGLWEMRKQRVVMVVPMLVMRWPLLVAENVQVSYALDGT